MTIWNILTWVVLVALVAVWSSLWVKQKRGEPLSSQDAQKLGSEMSRGAVEAGLIGVSFLLPVGIGAIIQGKTQMNPVAYMHFRAAIPLLCVSLMVGVINIFRLPTAVITTDITKDRATGTFLSGQFIAIFLAIFRVFVGAFYL